MKALSLVTFCFVFAVSILPASAGPEDGNWPGFRGHRPLGVAEGHATPLRWDAETGRNIKWKTAIPGMGHSSPVVWGRRIFVTTAISGKADAGLKAGLYGGVESVEDATEHVWRVYCLNKRTGKVVWSQDAVKAVPRVKRHTKATHANSTPATDGKHLVTFLGSEGLF